MMLAVEMQEIQFFLTKKINTIGLDISGSVIKINKKQNKHLRKKKFIKKNFCNFFKKKIKKNFLFT